MGEICIGATLGIGIVIEEDIIKHNFSEYHIFYFGINYIMHWNIFGYSPIYGHCFSIILVWMDCCYGMVKLDLVGHSYDLILESLCKLLNCLSKCSKFIQLKEGDWRLGWVT